MNEIGKFLFATLLIGIVLYAVANRLGVRAVLLETQQTVERVSENSARALREAERSIEGVTR